MTRARTMQSDYMHWAKFNAPVGLRIAPDGSIVIADTGNNVIRRLNLK